MEMTGESVTQHIDVEASRFLVGEATVRIEDVEVLSGEPIEICDLLRVESLERPMPSKLERSAA
jgi:hypothetical protein